MAEIIQVTSEGVSIGMDDGSILPVRLAELNFTPSLGDNVRVYRSEEKVIVTKIEKRREPAPAPQPQVIVNNANYNTNNNTNVNGYTRPVSPKSRWTAAILCFFFGLAGFHRFYVGKVGTGFLWLLTAGFFGIGAIVDFFSILFGNFTDKGGLLLK